MQGVTTAIVAFIFVCVVYPKLVKHKPQFYGALGLLMLVILFDAIAHLSTAPGLITAMYVLTALLQIITILLLVLCAGGLSVSDLAGEMANAVEVIRRGEDKPILVPLRGEQPKPREEQAAVRPPRPAKTKDDLSIPMD